VMPIILCDSVFGDRWQKGLLEGPVFVGWLPQSPGSSSKREPISHLPNDEPNKEGVCPGHIDGATYIYNVCCRLVAPVPRST